MRGKYQHSAKLTEEQAREIKYRRAAGEGGASLAREFSISQQTICCIHKGRQWAWLEEPS
jgi:DNA-binding XRE family transcriptional regulator